MKKRRKEGGIEADANGNTMLQSFVSRLFKEKSAEDTLVPPLWEKRNKKSVFIFICSLGCTRRNLCFHVENCQHPDQKQLTRRYTFDIESTQSQSASCRARPKNIDDGLEGITWIRGLGGEKLCAASYALLPNLKKGLFFVVGGGSRIFVVCFLHTSGQMYCIRRLAGARHITGRVVKTVTRR